MSVLIVIPARYDSQRYPGKPLAMLTGATGEARSLIHRSWLAAKAVEIADRVVVATDDDRIKQAAEAFGAEVVMTSSTCRNGTERCAEVARGIGADYEVIVNLQGDAPLTPAWFIDGIVAGLRADPATAISTPVLRCDGATLNGFRTDRANGRVGGTTAVFAADGAALYFSKEVVPFTSDTYADDAATPVFHHVGVYAYRQASLAAYGLMDVGPLEQLEGLEQLRFMENGHRVACVEVDARGRSFWELNNPADIPVIEAMLAKDGHP